MLGQGDRVGSADAEIRGEIVDAERAGAQAGHEGVARGRAYGLVAIGALHDDATRGEAVDMGRARERIAEAAEVRLQVIDADEQDVGARGGRGAEGTRRKSGDGQRESQKGEGAKRHGAEGTIRARRRLLRCVSPTGDARGASQVTLQSV